MIKRFLVAITIILASFFTLSITTSTPVSAAEYFKGDCRDFAGLTSWDCNVNINDANSLKSGIWTIVANVLKDITVIAAYLIIGYVIYGGYLYMMSSGDPVKIANGKKTLIHAFIGLAIVMLANVILNTIRIALGANFTGNCATNACAEPGAMITNAIQWVIAVAGIVSAIFIVYGGVGYMTSAGDAAKLQKAKTTILYAAIGLIIVALAEIITSFVSSTIRNSATNTNHDIVISKEVNEINLS